MLNCTGSTMIAAISPRVAIQDVFQRVRVVERRDDRFLNARSRQAGGRGHGRGRVDVADELARRLDRDEHIVVVAVVAALELEDLLAAGVATRDADGVHRRLGARSSRSGPGRSRSGA